MFAGYRRIAVAAAIPFLAVGALAVYLYLELGETNDLLADTRSTLATTEGVLDVTRQTLAVTETALADSRDRLATTRADLRRTDNALTVQRAANVSLTAEYGVLQAAKSAVEADKREVEATLQVANDRNAALSDENAGLQADLTATTRDRDGLREDLAGVNLELGNLMVTHNELEASHMTLTNEFEELQTQAGTAEGLREEILLLRAKILELEDARRPLILGVDATGRGGFACTGSMEPVVTCLDEATWLQDFRPEDIVVGATISFHPACWDDGEGRGTAHRVAAVEVRGGVHYYWPKGDNNLEADGCWIPEQNVQGYIVEIHRNVRPENAELREQVNAAIDAYKEAVTAYLELYDRHCERDRRCTVASAGARVGGSARRPGLLAEQRKGLPVPRPHSVDVLGATSGQVSRNGRRRAVRRRSRGCTATRRRARV